MGDYLEGERWVHGVHQRKDVHMLLAAIEVRNEKRGGH